MAATPSGIKQAEMCADLKRLKMFQPMPPKRAGLGAGWNTGWPWDELLLPC
jgi:hypothetical protein